MSASRDDEVAVPPAPQDTPKAVVKNVDMEQEMQQAIIEPNILSTSVCIYHTHNRPGHDGLFDLACLDARIKPSIEF